MSFIICYKLQFFINLYQYMIYLNKWFMEFSLDSYDWVMEYNIYSMDSYSDGEQFTTK